MSAYKGRRASNVSDFVQQLNNMTPPQELQPAVEFLNLPDDMALFANTEFNDTEFFSIGNLTRPEAEGTRPQSSYSTFPETFSKNEFAFHDFSAFQNIDIKPGQPQNFGASPVSPANVQNIGYKRKLGYMVDPLEPMEETSRMVADEDKRRRNTAASARFRIKKKQREQALEERAKEMSGRVAALEAENQQLKMENKWLKGIIVEKGDRENVVKGDKQSVENVDKENATTEERKMKQTESKEAERKDGVGTTT